MPLLNLKTVTREDMLTVLPTSKTVFGVATKEFGVRLLLARLDITGLAMGMIDDLLKKKKVPGLLQRPLKAIVRGRLNMLFEMAARDITNASTEDDVRRLLLLFPPGVTLQGLIEEISAPSFPDRLEEALAQLPEEMEGGSKEELRDLFMDVRGVVLDGLRELEKVYAEAG